MKIKGPGEGPPVPEELQPSAEPERARFAESLENASGIKDASASEVDGIANALRTGEVTPEKALEQLVARCIDEQIGADASPELRQRMIEAMSALVDQDPLLAEKLRQIEAKISR